MKRSLKGILSVLIAVVMLSSIMVIAVPSYAQGTETLSISTGDAIKAGIGFSTTDEAKTVLTRIMYKAVDWLINKLVAIIDYFYPGREWIDKDDYVSENFLSGMDTFRTSPAADAVWSLGYASESLQTGNELDGKHYVGGSLSFPSPKLVTAVYDDQRVRTIALNDGSGSGTLVFATLDAYGLSNTDVRKIRARLESFAEENNIISINVSVLHQHSCVDTLGMNGDILKAFFGNALLNGFKINTQLHNGINDEFMEHLFEVTVKSVKDAVNSMEQGELYYSAINVNEYIRDKRDPQVFDENLNRLRFVPADGGRETWITNAAIHCVGNGAGGTEVTGDYPYYMEQVVNEEANANFMLIQGAELAITSDGKNTSVEGNTRYENLTAYGTKLGEILVSIDNSTETKIAPMLNVRHAEINISVTNQILVFAANAGLVTNTAVKNDNGSLELVTEIGYIELGTDLAFAIIPGELAPELAYGGCLSASESWSGDDFEYPSMQEMVGSDRKLLVLGIANDQVGYILADNDYRSILTENEEIVATGSTAGSTVMEAFADLVSKD